MKFSREFGMPTPDAFDCPPIGAFVKRYLHGAKVSVDPFARNKRWATHTNDINPDTEAEYHMDALEFMEMLIAKGVQADVVILDPPYSSLQVSKHYTSGKQRHLADPTINVIFRRAAELIPVGGVCLSFGWNSAGLGKERGYTIEEILMVYHCGHKNDTICLAERRVQGNLFA